MNRLVRIALTLFASATIMVFLVNRRLVELKKFTATGQTVEAQMQNELIMIKIGMGLAGVMLVTGIVLMVMALIRAKKTKALPNG